MRQTFILLSAAAVLTFWAGHSFAQSWFVVPGSNRATAPAAIASSGPPASGFEIVCFQGEWVLYLFSAASPTSDTAPAEFFIDGQRFAAQWGIHGQADTGIKLTPQILSALRRGTFLQLSFPSGSRALSFTFPLRGSTRALNTVAANCAPAPPQPTPANQPLRFRTTPPQQDPVAMSMAQQLLDLFVAQSRRDDPNVAIQSAGRIILDDGWEFLIADIGFSTMLYGMAGFESIITMKPPSGPWQVADQKIGVVTYVDTVGRTNGYPDLYYLSVRGVNRPYGKWVWTGSAYTHAGNIGP